MHCQQKLLLRQRAGDTCVRNSRISIFAIALAEESRSSVGGRPHRPSRIVVRPQPDSRTDLLTIGAVERYRCGHAGFH